jgi:hypothetical protein
VPRGLTQKQRAVWNLKEEHPDWTFAKLGAVLGIAGTSANRRYNTAKKILGSPVVNAGMNKTDPDHLGQLLADFSDPRLKPVAEMALEEGMAPAAAYSLLRRLNEKYIKTSALVGEVKTEDTIKVLESGYQRIFESVLRTPDEELDEVPLRDRAVAGAVLLDKAQLLKNKPTEIVRTQADSERLTEMGAWLTEEVQRRAKATESDIDFVVDPETGEAHLVEMS